MMDQRAYSEDQESILDDRPECLQQRPALCHNLNNTSMQMSPEIISSPIFEYRPESHFRRLDDVLVLSQSLEL